MKKLSILGAIACFVCLLNGCKEKVDFNNIDTTMQADFGLVIPVGDMTVTAADFLGGNQVKVLYMDDDGIFHYMDTLNVPTRVFHPIDITQYIGETHKDFKVFQQLKDVLIDVGEDEWVVSDAIKGFPITLKFPLTLRLDKLNTDLNNERLDSIRVDSALLTSRINVKELGLDWSWINSVDVELGKQFKRAQGNKVRVYTKDEGKQSRYDYGDSIPIRIDNFTACFMKNPNDDPGPENVIDSCEFTFIFNFTIPKNSGEIIITESSAFSYDYKMVMLKTSAIWGYFSASNQVRDRGVICIQDDWEDWKNVQNMNLRLAEPSIKIGLWHQIAAPLILYLDTLRASNATQYVDATWNGKTKAPFPLDNVLHPILSQLTDSIFNDQLFNHEASQGHIDQLFDIRPDTFMYSFMLQVDENRKAQYPQHRINPLNTNISGYIALDIPMKFNDDMEASYFGKIEDLDFSNLDMDSLIKEIDEVEHGNAKAVKLFLTMTNNLPFEIDAKVKFLDKDSKDLNVILFKDSSLNHLHLPAPKLVRNSGEKYAHIETPSQSTFILNVDSAQWKTFTTCKHLDVEGIMGHNAEPCLLEGTNSLTVQVGVAANVEAIVNFNKKDEEE
ncbi:MAG: hypothetical protein MJZ79_01275 [Paludibacteraceae bacterium]|nr:hypothetical protein [Paludibacteraceae bacterium]